MAASALPTLHPYRTSGGPVETAATTDQVMLCPVTGASADRAGRRCRRAGWMLVAGLIVLFLGALAVGAGADPAAPQQPAPSPPPLPIPTVETCAPGSSLPICLPTPTTTAPTTTPSAPGTCSSIPPGQPRPPDCIPQPTTPPPSTGQQSPGTGGNNGDPDCGITDIGGCIAQAINSMFRDLVNAALSPILELLGHTALSTPTIDSLPGIGELWNNSFELVLAAYSLFVLIGGIVVMSHESVQARYSIKEIGPRIPVAFLASALSLFFADKAIQLANAFTLGVLGGGVNPPSLGTTLTNAVTGIASGGLFIILVGLVLVVVGLGLLIVYVVRIVITLILIISGPLFLMCHALPHTEPLARWWWKAIAAVLAIQLAQALVLITAVRTFLSSGVHLFGSTLSALGTLVAAIALFFILFKIPFWLLGSVRVSSRHSFIGGLARAYVAAKTFGMVAGKAGAFGKAGVASAASSGTGSGRRGGSAGAADPPWPTQPRLAPTPEMVSKRLKQAHDAERARAARRSRLPSQAPQFLQPTPQQTTHDPAVTQPTPGPTMPEFSSVPSPTTTPPSGSRSGPRPAAAPQFRAPHAPRSNSTPPAARPIRVASVPPHLQFTAPASEPAHLSQPAKPSAPAPSAPVFQQAHPEPRIGDARPRTPSVPPVTFRAPKPPPAKEGDTTP
jgi:hypothetical protein